MAGVGRGKWGGGEFTGVTARGHSSFDWIDNDCVLYLNVPTTCKVFHMDGSAQALTRAAAQTEITDQNLQCHQVTEYTDTETGSPSADLITSGLSHPVTAYTDTEVRQW